MLACKMGIPGLHSLGSGKSQRWQVYHCKRYLGVFHDFKLAVAAKAAAMNISSAELMRQGSTAIASRDKPSKFVGVTKVIKNDKVYWQAWAPRHSGGKAGYVGIATSAKRAADLLEHHIGEPPAKKKRNQWFDHERQHEHFQALILNLDFVFGTPMEIL